MATWKLLGSLNADRANTHNLEYLRQFITVASKSPINTSYPIFAWIVTNAVKKYSLTDQSKKQLRPIFEGLCLGAKLSRQLVSKSAWQTRNLRQNPSHDEKQANHIIGAGERDKAIKIVENWLETELCDYLVICDQFFGVEDLEILRHVLAIRATCKVYILTSKKQHDQENNSGQIDDIYRTYWRVHISDQDPPDTEVIIIGTKSTGKSPIHDRWWLTNGQGLRLGTSYKSIGKAQISDISLLSYEDTELKYKQVEPYLKKEKREHEGERLLYSAFYL